MSCHLFQIAAQIYTRFAYWRTDIEEILEITIGQGKEMPHLAMSGESFVNLHDAAPLPLARHRKFFLSDDAVFPQSPHLVFRSNTNL